MCCSMRSIDGEGDLMAQEAKYGFISVEGIPHDEPVFLLRGQDALAAMTVRHYAQLRQSAGDKLGHKQCQEVAADMERWPAKKMPD